MGRSIRKAGINIANCQLISDFLCFIIFVPSYRFIISESKMINNHAFYINIRQKKKYNNYNIEPSSVEVSKKEQLVLPGRIIPSP